MNEHEIVGNLTCPLIFEWFPYFDLISKARSFAIESIRLCLFLRHCDREVMFALVRQWLFTYVRYEM